MPRAHRGFRISRGGTSAPVSAGAIFLGAYFSGAIVLVKVACPCGHVGLADAATLPRELTCSACG